MFKKEVLPGYQACTMVMEALQEHFPHLTRHDMHAMPRGGYDKPTMHLLYCALFKDEHKDASLLVLKKWKEVLAEAGEEVNPHWFFEFLTDFFKQHHKKWKKMTGEQFRQWVEDNCEFHFVDE